MIEWLQSLPTEWANYISMLLFLALAVFTLSIPSKAIFAGLLKPKTWQDIRYWALLLITIQVAIYVVFQRA
tara:strand:- start:5604 stop:5816 length:213 start_codon:yes stop_codon:yes gene_type:complete